MTRGSLAAILVLALGSCSHRAHRAPETEADRRVAYYEAKLAGLPRHYPSLALLASAELEKAKETGDPAWLARARLSVAESMAIQPNVEAMKAGAAIASYSHRFADALELARRARAAYPPDTGVAALEVEARLGLGDVDAAEKTLATFPADDFHAAFARGLVFAARGKAADAASSYALAAERAAAEGVAPLTLFATVSAAGAYLDSGDPAAARPFLDRAESLDGNDRRLRIHRVEWLEATGRRDEALAAVEALIESRDEAELRRRAARLSRERGDAARAETHFAAARALYRIPIEAGEAYTLEGMALLLAEAGVDLDEAVALATRNLEWKRDAAAREALEFARERLAGRRAGAGGV